MASLSINSKIVFIIDGNLFQPPANWLEIGVKASFIEGDVQPAITIEDFEFILDAYNYLKSWIDNGRIFEGVPFAIYAYNNNSSRLIFDGFIDLRDAVRDEVNGRITAKVRYRDDVSSISLRLSALDYGYLYRIGVYNDSDFIDVDYAVVKIDYTIEAFIQSITLYLMLKQLYELTRIIGDNIATINGILAAGVTGSVGSLIYAIGSALVNIAYATLMIVQILQLGTDIILAFLQPKRTHKASTFRSLVEKVCNYLGYSFSTSISELDRYVYLASNTNVDKYDDIRGFLSIPKSIEIGLPNILDNGHRCDDLFGIVKTMFNAKFAVINNEIVLHSELAPFWQLNSTYEMPDILPTPFKYNTDDLTSVLYVNFRTDLVDGYTIENFKGTNYEAVTTLITAIDEKSVTLEGFQEFAIPLALGSRKDKLNGFEKTLKTLAAVIDGVINTISTLFFISGSSNLEAQITQRIGILKVESNNHSVAKAIYLDSNGRIPANHRDLLSAKYLYENYINQHSFLQNSQRRQRKIYEGVEIPFGFEDYKKLVNNSYFTTPSGQIGKVTELDWQFASDKAVISYYIESPFTLNLKETFIEPE